MSSSSITFSINESMSLHQRCLQFPLQFLSFSLASSFQFAFGAQLHLERLSLWVAIQPDMTFKKTITYKLNQLLLTFIIPRGSLYRTVIVDPSGCTSNVGYVRTYMDRPMLPIDARWELSCLV